MAKKYEFKPDRPYSNWLGQLYLTRKQRKVLLKWVLYALVLLILSLLQDTVLSNLRLMGATSDLVPCGIFVICLLEGSHTGSIFALVASSLFVFSGSAPGVYSIPMITALAIAVTLFRQAFLQRGFTSAMLCCIIAICTYQMLVFLLGVFLGLTTLDRYVGFLITAALSLIAAPALYPICLAIGKIGGETWKE